MIICLCHRISDRDIARAVASGCDGFDELQEHSRVGTACGACVGHAHEAFSRQAGGRCGDCSGAGRCGVTPARAGA